jgi:hypothetical protein
VGAVSWVSTSVLLSMARYTSYGGLNWHKMSFLIVLYTHAEGM